MQNKIILLANAVTTLPPNQFKQATTRFIANYPQEIIQSKIDLPNILNRLGPFVREFEIKSIAYRTLSTEWVQNFYSKLLLDFVLRGPDQAVQNLLKVKVNDRECLFLDPTNPDSLAEDKVEIVERGFELLGKLVTNFHLEEHTIQVIEEYTLPYLWRDIGEFYQITRRHRLVAIEFLSRKIQVHSTDAMDKISAIYKATRDIAIKQASQQFLITNQVKFIPHQIKRIVTALNEKDFVAVRRKSRVIDDIFGPLDPLIMLPILGNGYRDALISLKNTTGAIGIQVNQFLNSAFVDNQDISMSFSLKTFHKKNAELEKFRAKLERKIPGSFNHLLRIWGIANLAKWAEDIAILDTDFFKLLANTALNTSIISGYHPIKNPVARHLEKIFFKLNTEADHKTGVFELARFLSATSYNFDFEVFQIIFENMAQRQTQNIRRLNKFHDTSGEFDNDPVFEARTPEVKMQDPTNYKPLIIYLIAALELNNILVPATSFIETNISCLLNTWWPAAKSSDLECQLWQLDYLISLLPCAVNPSFENEGRMREAIATIDEFFKHAHPLFANLRIRIHTHPSPADWKICQTILSFLPGEDPNIEQLVSHLESLMRDFPVEFKEFSKFAIIPENRVKLESRGRLLKQLTAIFPDVPFKEMAAHSDFETRLRAIEKIDNEDYLVVRNLLILANTLYIRWERRTSIDVIQAILPGSLFGDWSRLTNRERLEKVNLAQSFIRTKMILPLAEIEAQENIRGVRHTTKRVGFRRQYLEFKYDLYSQANTLIMLERELIEQIANELVTIPRIPNIGPYFQEWVKVVISIMKHLNRQGLGNSLHFQETIEVLEKDDLTVGMLADIVQLILSKELPKIHEQRLLTFEKPLLNLLNAMTTQQIRNRFNFPLEKSAQQCREDALNQILQNNMKSNDKSTRTSMYILWKLLSPLLRQGVESSTLIPALLKRKPGEISPVTHGYTAFNMDTLRSMGYKVPPFEVLTTSWLKENEELLKEENREKLNDALIEQILLLEKKTGKFFPFLSKKLTSAQNQKINQARNFKEFDSSKVLELAIRGSSYRLLPSIFLGSVLHLGITPTTPKMLRTMPKNELRARLDEERVFLTTFGKVRLGIAEKEFSEAIVRIKRTAHLRRKVKKYCPIEELNNEECYQIIEAFRKRLNKANHLAPIDYNDPLALIAESVTGIWQNWDREETVEELARSNYSRDWGSAIIFQEMKEPHNHPLSFSASLFTGNLDDGQFLPSGTFLFGRVGVDLASGKTTGGIDMPGIAKLYPALNTMLTNMLADIRNDNGDLPVNLDIVGEFDPAAQSWTIFDLHYKQMPINPISPMARIDLINPKPGDFIAKGRGVYGGASTGRIVNGTKLSASELKIRIASLRKFLNNVGEENTKIFLFLDYATSEEIQKLSISEVDAVITTKGGHGNIAYMAARLGKSLIELFPVTHEGAYWQTEDGKRLIFEILEYTISAQPQHKSIYSGALYRGRQSTRVI